MRTGAVAIVPQLLTATRVVLGTYALMAALDGHLYVAATLISLGAVTDGLDGLAARWLNAASSFGALFDYFADYLCYVIAPYGDVGLVQFHGAAGGVDDLALAERGDVVGAPVEVRGVDHVGGRAVMVEIGVAGPGAAPVRV